MLIGRQGGPGSGQCWELRECGLEPRTFSWPWPLGFTLTTSGKGEKPPAVSAEPRDLRGVYQSPL